MLAKMGRRGTRPKQQHFASYTQLPLERARKVLLLQVRLSAGGKGGTQLPLERARKVLLLQVRLSEDWGGGLGTLLTPRPSLPSYLLPSPRRCLASTGTSWSGASTARRPLQCGPSCTTGACVRGGEGRGGEAPRVLPQALHSLPLLLACLLLRWQGRRSPRSPGLARRRGWTASLWQAQRPGSGATR